MSPNPLGKVSGCEPSVARGGTAARPAIIEMQTIMCFTKSPLFDQLLGSGQKRFRDGEPERLGVY